MLKAVLKPLAAPAILFLIGISTNVMNFKNDWLAGFLMGIAFFWAVIALFLNKPLLNRLPRLTEWIPFLNASGAPLSAVLTESIIVRKHVRIGDLALENKIINRTFEDCDIYGPAVLRTSGFGYIVESRFDGPGDHVFIEISENQKAAIGPIEVTGCSFRRCRFHGIGFIVSGAEKATLKAKNQDMPTLTP